MLVDVSNEYYEIYQHNQLIQIKNFSENLPPGTVVYSDEIVNESASNQAIPTQNPCPSTQNWLGDYNFQLIFQSAKSTTKSISWTYSEELNKLFVAVYKFCPINVKTNPLPPQGCYIRALPVFSQSEHISEIVRRCPNHSGPNDPNNSGHPAPHHLVRCELNTTEYQTCPQTGRLSIMMPYYPPEAGTDFTTYLLQFMCYGSCVGGLNRRPIQMIFTLEKDDQVLGRQVLPMKICACPGRDRQTEEVIRFSKVKGEERPKPSFDKAGPPTKKLKICDEGDFVIRVQKREHYEMLQKIKISLELAEMVTDEQLKAYQERRKESVSVIMK